MTYKSILLNLNIDGVVAPIIKLGVELARRFDARLIGFSAADVPPPIVMEGGTTFEGESMMVQLQNIERRIEDLRSELEGLAGTTVESEWCGAVGNPTRLLINAACAADLIVTASPESVFSGNVHRSTDLGSLILQAGRPVFVAANDQKSIRLSKVIVGWKNTREARRAVVDAMPFLRLAQEVRIITISEEATDEVWSSLNDVVAFLSGHGVEAKAEIFPEKSDGGTIVDVAVAMDADLIISGGYGHSRLREWMFGGATRSLLGNDRLNRVMSH
ncbi:universal stress protein [Rhizobium ruizarguesonis]|uniref:Universal stress protein n=1 Tax=Rhizobium ruizarguesonis TaxID=2081791 RepID=A0ABY1WW00_9HYPH|nr:universal stress protein [Rhizobium ruizarguesonis]TAU13126.1 universal stress protein [Rhizobium ruizarguesonis]TAU57030.1 universal stress protein [Rhizobium ruizarguesonis]TAV19031.1 universal stress protein [Rhizobium ruizarguesonis]TAW01874.1 universal stress protein [Rhizobium ruizarguesonis]TAW47946.1 universal stress protein [Rhizobium ruizarguesonis]